MAPLRNVLCKILSAENDFCSSCFQDIAENEITYEDFPLDDDIKLLQVLEFIFDQEVLNTMFTVGGLCKECRTSAINSYKFIKMCKENSKNLLNSVIMVSESIDNIEEDLSHCNSVFISLNEEDFTSKQYYDDQCPVHSLSAAHNRFVSLLHYEEKPKLCIKEDPDLPRNVERKINNVRKKRMPIIYDIPSIPTEYIRLKSNDTDFKCKVCYKAFQETNNLRRHFFRYHYPRDVKCGKCPRSFISKEMLHYHNDLCHSDAFCSQCGKHFNNIYILKKHESDHNLKIVCQECGRVYKSKEAYNNHVSNNVCKQKMRQSSDQGKYVCDHCNKRYCNKPYLAKHIKYEHENAEGFRCKFCNKKFYTPSGLTAHIVKHTLEKKFECLICKRKFVSKHSLIYHTRLHTGEKPYHCDFCDKAFVSASRRLDHTRRNHLAPALECQICHSKFKGIGSLLKHKKRHLNPESRINYQYIE